MVCKYCSTQKITDWYYSDDWWVICTDAENVGAIIIYKQHISIDDIGNSELQYILREATSIFGFFRIVNEGVPEHFHWHLKLEDYEL